MLLCAFALWLQGTAFSQSPSATDLGRQAERRITELHAEADRLAVETSTTLTTLRRLELQRQIKVQELARAEAELGDLTAQFEQASARVDALEATRRAEAPWVQQRIVEVYKRGRLEYVRMLLTADNLRDIGRMSRALAELARLAHVRLENHRQTIRNERVALADLDKRRAEVDQARVAATRARRAMDAAVAASARHLEELDRRRDLAARYIGELQSAQQELQRSVESFSSAGTRALPLEPFRGGLDWPIRGAVLSRFGPSTADRFGTTIVRNGIEIAAEEGAAIHAVHGGTVAYSAPFTGFGTLVIVDHGNNAFTLYGHLSQATVVRGSTVGRGDVLGRAGRTPTGQPAAYFELRIDGRPVDPVQWLRSLR
jgi:murein hydrolase activator